MVPKIESVSELQSQERQPPPTPPLSPTPPPAGVRTEWISWLRVLAIIGVVLIHTAGLTAVQPGARATLLGRLGITLDFSVRWAVPVFVMLSGALLLDPSRWRGPTDFLRKRAIRLLPAILVWNVVYLGLRWAGGKRYDAHTALVWLLTGKVYTALYFFWIVLGLAVFTPVLIPWVARARRRQLITVGAVLALLPVFTVLAAGVRCTTNAQCRPGASWENPWSWWVPYLGFYILGWALRTVQLGRAAVLAAAATVVAVSALLCWQWRNPGHWSGRWELYAPGDSYQTPQVLVLAVTVYLLAGSLAQPGRLLGALTGTRAAALGRRLGDATLGVFVTHLLVLEWVLRWPVVGGQRYATSVPQLLAQCVSVVVVTYVLVLVGRQVPGLRRLL